MSDRPVPDRPLPEPTPETRFFWEATREGRLLVQRCIACEKAYFPPRPFCPKCGSRDVEPLACSGEARLLSYVINQRLHPKWKWREPYSIAIVELAEGPCMLTNIVGCPQTPEVLVLDMPLRVAFEAVTDKVTLPVFEPAGVDA